MSVIKNSSGTTLANELLFSLTAPLDSMFTDSNRQILHTMPLTRSPGEPDPTGKFLMFLLWSPMGPALNSNMVSSRFWNKDIKRHIRNENTFNGANSWQEEEGFCVLCALRAALQRQDPQTHIVCGLKHTIRGGQPQDITFARGSCHT